MKPDTISGNKLVNKFLDLFPNDPLTQTKFVYYLTVIIWVGLGGYAVTSWITVFTAFTWGSLFQSIFMSAIALTVTLGLKQSRNTYLMIKATMGKNASPPDIESKEEMLEAFKDE